MLKINIDEIGGGLTLKESIAAAAFPEVKAMQEAGELSFAGPITFELSLKKLEDIIIIDGVLKGEARMNCGRCLNDYTQSIESDFKFKGVPAAQIETRNEKEIELLEDDLDSFAYNGNTLDLREVLQEQVILALPLACVCREDCKGLCPSCGVDLNQGSCDCDNRQGHPAFGALKDLF